MSDATSFNLAGKDWFTELEAAFYCGVSPSQFSKHYTELGIHPRRFMGKKLYSRLELSEVIERSDPWHREPVFVSPVRFEPSPEVRAALGRLNAYERNRKPYKPRRP
jgi:hypothetical protein